jgi:hypothetical protein
MELINFVRIRIAYEYVPGTAVAQCLRHCATNQKVPVSTPDNVIEIFH